MVSWRRSASASSEFNSSLTISSSLSLSVAIFKTSCCCLSCASRCKESRVFRTATSACVDKISSDDKALCTLMVSRHASSSASRDESSSRRLATRMAVAGSRLNAATLRSSIALRWSSSSVRNSSLMALKAASLIVASNEDSLFAFSCAARSEQISCLSASISASSAAISSDADIFCSRGAAAIFAATAVSSLFTASLCSCSSTFSTACAWIEASPTRIRLLTSTSTSSRDATCSTNSARVLISWNSSSKWSVERCKL
mmetsp:Transcript_54593/g.152324  ORF Transcript_54593/g.152324 Transcript_54593/m.152324 type:complete len:258 (+) Transcript_54593:2822-3595(+)